MAIFFILAGAAVRVLSHFDFIAHLPNFAPIAAMALFGGVYLNKKYALIVPLTAMLLADVFIGFYSPWLMASVYGSFLLIGLMGLWLKNNKTFTNVIGASLLGSIAFFLITNFGMWAVQPIMPTAIYPQTWQGLIDSYIMGLPFFRNTILGDLFYAGAMFGLMEAVLWVTRKVTSKRSQVVKI
jgi:hypothetical protein